jgi:hypothetical protein
MFFIFLASSCPAVFAASSGSKAAVSFQYSVG